MVFHHTTMAHICLLYLAYVNFATIVALLHKHFLRRAVPISYDV